MVLDFGLEDIFLQELSVVQRVRDREKMRLWNVTSTRGHLKTPSSAGAAPQVKR